MYLISILKICFIFVTYFNEIPAYLVEINDNIPSNMLKYREEADIPDLEIKDVLEEDHWFITREKWLAKVHNNTETTDEYDPLRIVVVSHTVSYPCNTFLACAAEMRILQSYFLTVLNYDIPYNFLIGNDGRVYEGRGWNKVGAHIRGYNQCTVGLAFVGDYREGPSFSKVTELQQVRAHMLFELGVKLGYLHPNFHVLGAMDLHKTISPGGNLYKAIREWPNYDHQNLYKNRTCKQIKELYESVEDVN